MEYGSIADALGNWFLDRPVDVTMAADMQCRLVELLRREFEASGDLLTRYPNPSVTDDGNFAQYKPRSNPSAQRSLLTTFVAKHGRCRI